MASQSDRHDARRALEFSRDFQAACSHDQAGRRDRAEALYREVLNKAPDHADALHLLGVIAHERGRHQRAIETTEALQAHRRAIALKPHYAVAHCNLAGVQIEQRAFAAALPSADRAIALAPNVVEAHLNRADALTRQRRFEAAEAALRRAIDVVPGRAASGRAGEREVPPS